MEAAAYPFFYITPHMFKELINRYNKRQAPIESMAPIGKAAFVRVLHLPNCTTCRQAMCASADIVAHIPWSGHQRINPFRTIARPCIAQNATCCAQATRP